MTTITLPAIVRRKAAKHHFNLWLHIRCGGGAVTVYSHLRPAMLAARPGCKPIRPVDAVRVARMGRWSGLTRAQRQARRIL